MEILLKIDWNVLNTYIDNKKIIANKHPDYDIWILNYSKETAFERAWDTYTISCRGLVVDSDGNILARPIEKFFNYNEPLPYEINYNQPFEIFTKMDGSLIITFFYKPTNEWIVASRGSFVSEQAVLATKYFKTKPLDLFNKNHTYVFELISDVSRIVVDYGGLKDIILLAEIDTESGVEIPYDEMLDRFLLYVRVVNKPFPENTNLDYLKSLDIDNEEGFVVRFKDGKRIKVKFDEYCRLHRIVTNVSNKSVWEHLMNGLPFDEFLERVPDEFYNWLKKTKSDLERQFKDVEHEILKEFYQIYFKEGCTERKTFAEKAVQSKNRGFLFALYSGKDYNEAIWKKIRPIYSKGYFLKDNLEDS